MCSLKKISRSQVTKKKKKTKELLQIKTKESWQADIIQDPEPILKCCIFTIKDISGQLVKCEHGLWERAICQCYYSDVDNDIVAM